MTETNKLIAQRLASQGLLTKKENVLDVIRTTVGLQAQDQRQAELNLAIRTQNLKLSALTALYQQREIVRSWANRWTLQLLTYEDWELLINARQAEQLPRNYFQGQETAVLSAVERLAKELEVRQSLTHVEVEQLLNQLAPQLNARQENHGVPPRYAVLHELMRQGICYFDAASSARHYRLFYAQHFRTMPANKAIEELIKRYLIGFSPATLEDFVKWSDLKISSVRKIWREMSPEQPSALTKALSGSTIITARFDSLLTGYADKTWLTPADRISELWTKNGILLAPIIVDGELAGRWSFEISGQKICFLVKHWRPFRLADLEEKYAELAQFLGKEMGETRVEKMD